MRKKKLLIVGIVVLVIIVGLASIVGSKDFQIASKNDQADKIVEKYKNGEMEKDVANANLTKLRNSNIKEISEYAQKSMSRISKIYNGNMVLDEARESMASNSIKENGISEKSKYWHIDRISKSIKSDDDLYKESLEVIAELTKYSQKELNITYSKEKTTAGLQKVRIKVENKTGKDINYIRLDFFEKNKDGYISNSGWTNTSKTIKNNSSVNIETYHDFTGSETTLEFEISDIRYAN